MKLPLTFDGENGGLYDADKVCLCRVMYQLGRSREQIDDMVALAKAVNESQAKDAEIERFRNAEIAKYS